MKTKLFLLLAFYFALQGSIKAQYTKLLDFNGTNGSVPKGDLFFDGTYLYGTTGYGGGSSNNGVFFKIKPNGSAYQNLHSFQGMNFGDGAFPNSSLIFDGTYFYGTTNLGGATNKGIIFKIKPNGTGYSNAHDFLNYTPIGSPVFNGINFYGVTSVGILKMNLSLPNDTFVYSFTGNEGTNPFGSITYDGTYIYGTTNQGGINGKGVVFKVKPDGSAYDTLLNFGTTLGANPVATPFYDGTFIYGTTLNGGTNNMGTIYRVKSDGTGDTALFSFSSSTGYQPEGALILVRGHLYGMASNGGINGSGTIFRIRPDGSNYIKLLDFNGSINGSAPQGSLISDGTFLYGMTTQGGANNNGTIFKLNIPVVISNQNLTICQGQSISVSSHTYSVTGTYADTLFSSLQDCDSIINTSLTVLSSSSSTSQSYTLCSGQIVNVGTDIYATSGTYTYTYSGGGCDSTVITNLIVNASPTVSVSGDTSVCVGQTGTTTLTASGGGTYLWSTASTASSIIVSPTTNTTYSVIATNGSCVDTAFVNVRANVSPHAGFHSSISVCCASNWFFMDTTHAVSGDPITVWHWTFSGGYPDTSSTKNSQVSLPGGNHTICLTVTTQNGCKDSTCESIFSYSIEKFANSSSILVYPNPTTTTLQISFSGTHDPLKDILISDVLGKEVIKNIDLKTQNGITQIDVSNLPAGVYFVKTNLGTQKFIKQ